MRGSSNVGSTADETGAVSNRLGPGTPAFTAYKISELPTIWHDCLAHPGTAYVALEVPDTPWGWSYYRWYASVADRNSPGVYVPVMMVNMHDYNGGTAQRKAAAAVLRSLLETGRPTANWIRVLKDTQQLGNQSQTPSLQE